MRLVYGATLPVYIANLTIFVLYTDVINRTDKKKHKALLGPSLLGSLVEHSTCVSSVSRSIATASANILRDD